MNNKYKAAIAEDLIQLKRKNSDGKKINIANYIDDVFLYIIETFEVKQQVKRNLVIKGVIDKFNYYKNYIILRLKN